MLNEKFLYLFFQSPRYRNQIKDLSSGSAQPGVNGSKLNTLRLPIPTLKEQLEIISIISPILVKSNNIIESGVSISEKIHMLKKTIINEAFHGKLINA